MRLLRGQVVVAGLCLVIVWLSHTPVTLKSRRELTEARIQALRMQLNANGLSAPADASPAHCAKILSSLAKDGTFGDELKQVQDALCPNTPTSPGDGGGGGDIPRCIPTAPLCPPVSCPKCVTPINVTNVRPKPEVPAPAVSDVNASGPRVLIEPLPQARVLPPNAAKTSYKCFTSSDWAQICTYNLLCTDGDQAVIIDDSRARGSPVTSFFGIGDDPVGYHTFDVFPRPPPQSAGLPLNTRIRAYYESSAALATAEWSDRTMWLLEPEYRGWEVQHIFFFSHVVFPLWEARESNDTWGRVLPPIEDVYLMVKRKFKMNDWGANVMDTLLPKSARLGYLDDLETYSRGRLRCSRRGVLSGNKPNVFSGMKPAFNFRSAVYSKFGIVSLPHPRKKLLLYNRANAGRRFENIDEMEALFKRYDIMYEILAKPGSFQDQVTAMSNAGVVLVAHGAAAMNTMFQQHRSVFIEVFPYLRKRFGFMSVAQAIGNFYFPIFAWQKPRSGKSVMNETAFIQTCDPISSIYTNREFVCDQAQKVVTIYVDIPTLERTLIDAFDVIGYRIYDSTKPGSPTYKVWK